MAENDPDSRDPRDEGLRRRSGNATLSPWLIVALILLLGVVVYVVSTMMAG